jgi:hypothetical protein
MAIGASSAGITHTHPPPVTTMAAQGRRRESDMPMEWEEIVTAAEYVEFRQKTRPFRVTLAEFIENYPNEVLFDEWRKLLPDMFRTAQEPASIYVIRSIDKHCDSAMAFLQQMHKFYPEKLPPNWWEQLESWKEKQK